MDQQDQPRGRPARRQLQWAGATAVLLTIAILIGYRHDITLWDWIKLLVVPAVIAGVGIWFNHQQREREQRTAERRAQDETLQAYLDGMSQLLTDKEQPLHSARPEDRLSTVARARTLTVLGRLDSLRKRSVLQFLYESGLIFKEHTLLNESDLIERQHNIVGLRGADLSGARLRFATLIDADLSEANLHKADLSSADLSGADLIGTDLREASLMGADLSGANLKGAVLFSGFLREADLSDAKWWTTKEQLEQAKSLEGAIMPNGMLYEDWVNWLQDMKNRNEKPR